MQRDRRKVEKALEAKGFSRGEGDHHWFLYSTKSGKTSSIRTKTSHSGKEMGITLLRQMAQQCHLSRQDFLSLVDCDLSREDYEIMIQDWLK
jgi:predicted RNA binding protein YcfA (HicA-like mRNA interferase family)